MEPFESKLLRLCMSWRDYLYCIWKTLKNYLCDIFPFLDSGLIRETIFSENTCSIFFYLFFFPTSFFPLPSLRTLRPGPPILKSSNRFQYHSLPFLRQFSTVLKHLPPHLWHVPLLLKPSQNGAHILWSSPTPSKVLSTAFEKQLHLMQSQTLQGPQYTLWCPCQV